MRIKIALASLVLAASSALAQTVYIKDELTLRLRSGPGTSFDVANSGVVSGTALEATGKEENGWREVRYQGQTVWVNGYFLQDEPIAAVRLEQLQSEYEALQAQLDEALAEGPLTADEITQIRSDIEVARMERQEAIDELEAVQRLSENAINLDSRNSELSQRNRELELELQQLEAENQLLRDEKATRQWLLIGFAVVIGLCVGLFIMSVRPKNKRHDTWV